MADPVTLGVIITGLVSAYKAYTEYKAAVVKAEAEKATPPAKSQEAVKGEQVAQVLETGIQKHGNDDEHADLASFKRNPERYRDAFVRVLSDIATRESDFASQLQTIAQEAKIQTGGVQGTVNMSDNARADIAVGVSSGPITYNAGERKSE